LKRQNRTIMFRHLRTKLTVLYAGLFALALVLVSAAVYGAVTENARHVVRNELTAGGAVFDRIWALRSEQLGQGATVLSHDFGFRSAVATGDKATIQSALENLRGRLDLDLAFLVGLDGHVISTGDAGAEGEAADLLPQLQADDQASGVFTIGKSTYQAIATPVAAPTTIGWVVFARKLDKDEMASLEQLSAIPLDATVLSRAADGSWASRTSALKGADALAVSRFIRGALNHPQGRGNSGGAMQLRTSNGQAIALVKPLKSMSASSPAVLLLRYPLARALAPYRPLLAIIVLTGLAGIVVFVMGSALLARSLTRPISALDNAAHKLQNGERVVVPTHGRDEIGRLSVSFNHMATTIRQREDELRSTRAFLDAVVENLPAMVVVKDLDQRLVLVNRAGEDLIGVDRADMLGKTDHDLFPKEQADQFVERDRAVMASGRLEIILDEPITTRERGLRYLQTKKIAIPDAEGRPQYLVAISEDITERKQAAEALGRALDQAEAANRAKNSFLTNMSHEVRTPLNGVLGVAGVLSATALDQDQREMVGIIESSAEVLQRVLNDVLDLANAEAGRLEIIEETFDLSGALRAMAAGADAQSQAKGVGFRLETDPAIEGLVIGARARLEQVIGNLLSNAVKFTDTGEIVLSAAPVEDQDGRFRFQVRDTGIGFDPAVTEALFEPFRQVDGSLTRQFGGTGLGLSLSRDLVRAMGGELTAEGAPGEGSVFTVVLPLRPAAEVACEPAAASGDSRPSLESPDTDDQPLRILLVDDHATNRKVVQLILGTVGVETMSAENGAEAVAAFETNPFDLVLMDLQMPVMDGLTAIRHIRRCEAARGGRRTPILVLSANTMPEHLDGSNAAGADGHLAKPITAPVLLAALEEALTAAEGWDVAVSAA
jgi:PAS domain S-box-containing protein